jgi:predicted dehydrogenase
MDDVDPVDGPNLFGGDVLMRTRAEYRWKGLPRQQPFPEWRKVPVEHGFNELGHRENSRGIGLVDMAYAIRDERPERASGAMALHALEVMDQLLESAHTGQVLTPSTTFARPAPLPVDFPHSEG